MQTKKYKIKYVEGDTINKVTVINANNSAHAMTLFYLDFPNCEVMAISEVTE